MKLEILYFTPEDLLQARVKPVEPRYAKINGRDVNTLSYTKLKNGDVVVSWVDPHTGTRFVRRYRSRPGLTITTYNKRRTKTTITINGKHETEVFEKNVNH